jgi:hypothetical protein
MTNFFNLKYTSFFYQYSCIILIDSKDRLKNILIDSKDKNAISQL